MTNKRTKNEHVKEASRQLRGTIRQGLDEVSTGAIADDDQMLVRFHGTYLQDDRDVRHERAKKMLEKAYSFMIRVRLPGGVTTSIWCASTAPTCRTTATCAGNAPRSGWRRPTAS